MSEKDGIAFPLVSVIIRSTDRPTLRQALASVAAQSYPNIEVVLVNAKGPGHGEPGSSCGRFPLCVVGPGEPLRRSRAANLGLENARGDYLIFLDDDDWFMPEHVSLLADALTRNPDKKVAYSCVAGADEQKNPIDKNFCQPFDRTRLLAGNYIPIHAVLFSHAIVDGGCRMDESLDLYEDWDFWLQAAAYGDFVFVEHFSAYYRIGSQFGQGVRPDAMVMQQIRGDLLEKWRKEWRREDLLNIMARVGEHEIKLITLAAEKNALAAEKNALAAEKNALAAERDEQVAALNRVVAERDRQIVGLQAIIKDYHSSTSWRITKPLRSVGRWVRQFKIMRALLADYRSRYPGLAGYRRMANRFFAAWRSGGVRALASLYRTRTVNLSENARGPRPAIECLHEMALQGELPLQDVAVHVHVFYTDLLAEIRSYLANIPASFTLYITTDSDAKIALIRQAFTSLERVCDLVIYPVENRGRDIAPMVVALGERLRRHGLVLHIHTKKSPHNHDLRGWRTYLMRALLGSRETVAAILNRFARDASLGIFYPAPYYPVQPFMQLGGNELHIYGLLRRAGRPMSDMDAIDKNNFPAGAMFWFRGKAIERLIEMHLCNDDFDVESGQDDATLAHSIERVFPYFSSLEGLSTVPYLPSRMYYPPLPGALPLTEMEGAVTQPFGESRRARIVFDHNIGGGTNLYSSELTNSIVSEGLLAVRVYYCHLDAAWVVQVVDEGNGMIYAAPGMDELFDVLAVATCDAIVINSLIGFPAVDKVISHIIQLSSKLGALIDYKVHDFYAVCPSQHLMSADNRYCGVPKDNETCGACLNVNLNASWDGIRIPSISEWRTPFVRLFDAVSEITIFDLSSAEILQRAFDLPMGKMVVKPHENHASMSVDPIDIVDTLHIGVLGTLTLAKGAHVVNSLAQFIRKEGLKIPITVIGRSLVEMDSGVKVLGDYEARDLRNIVKRNKITVFLMASIIPETFSYTISEAIEMGLPIVAFDVGAQGQRIRLYDKGRVVPLNSSSAVIFNVLHDVWSAAREKVS